MSPVRHAWESTASRASQVFGECAACGYGLGGATAFIAVLITGTVVSGLDSLAGVLLYGLLAGGFGGGIGLVIGLVVGAVLYLLVRSGESRLGARRVAQLFPIIAVCLTLPVGILVGSVAGVAWLVSVVTLDAVLTLAGARFIAHRYLRRAEGAHLH